MAAKNFSLLAGVVAFAVSGSAFALKSDKNQATNIDAAVRSLQAFQQAQGGSRLAWKMKWHK